MSEFTLVGFAVLREVAARGSFTAAAAGLGYTQSGISRQVRTLEQAAGEPLFRRTRDGAELTAAGRGLLEHALAALDHAAAARASFSPAARPERVRLGALASTLSVLVPRALATLAQAVAPTPQIELREGTSDAQLRRLRGGRLDVAVVARPDGATDATLIDEPLLLAVARGHRLTVCSPVASDALRDERWIVGSADPRSPLLGALPMTDWRPHVAHVARDWTAKLGLVAAGQGVTIVPGLAAPGVRDDVVLLRIAGAPAPRRTIAIMTSAEPSRGATACAQALADAAPGVVAQALARAI